MFKKTIIGLSAVFFSVQSAQAEDIEFHYGYNGNIREMPKVIGLDDLLLNDYMTIDGLSRKMSGDGFMSVVDDPNRPSGEVIVDEYVLVAYPLNKLKESDLENSNGIIFKNENSSSDECVYVSAQSVSFDMLDNNGRMNRLIISLDPKLLSEIDRTGCLALERRNIPAPI